MNRKGFTLVEALASIVILSFVFTAIITIIVNVRIQTIRTEERVVAIEIAKSIRDDIENDVTYAEIINNISDSSYVITQDNCGAITNGCSFFNYSVGDRQFNDNVTITFLQSTPQSLDYQVIHFEVSIAYFRNDTLLVEGILYES